MEHKVPSPRIRHKAFQLQPASITMKSKYIEARYERNGVNGSDLPLPHHRHARELGAYHPPNPCK